MISDALYGLFAIALLIAMIVASAAFVIAFFPWIVGAAVVFYGGGALINWVSRHERRRT